MMCEPGRVSAECLFPSQYYLLRDKLEAVISNFNNSLFEPLPVVKEKEGFVLADGHHRTALLFLFAKSCSANISIPVRVVSPSSIAEYVEWRNPGRLFKSIGSSAVEHYTRFIPCRDLIVEEGKVYAPVGKRRDLILILPGEDKVRRALERYNNYPELRIAA